MESENKSIEYKLKTEKHEFPVMQITNPEDLAAFARNFYGDDMDIYESLFLVTMNNTSMTTGFAKISQGGLCETSVDVRLIAKYAIDALATKIAIVHNHPSGNLNPSEADKKMTRKVQEALELFSIRLLDSLIISSTGYYSFNDEGLIY